MTGFDEDLYLVFEPDGFYFAHKVGDTGLVVNLEDEHVHNQAIDLLFEALEKIQ